MKSTHNELVRALMNLDDLNAKHVAVATALTPSTLSRFLNAKTDIKAESFLKVLKFLGVDLHHILRREILNRLNGRTHKSQSTDDDLLLVMHSLNEIDQKTILSTIISALPTTAGAEAQDACERLFRQSKSLALRKRRYA